MPGTRTTTSVGPILGARYPIDAELVSDEVNLNECDRTASGIVYKEPHGQGKFGAVVYDADGNERCVVVVNEPSESFSHMTWLEAKRGQ